MKLLEFAECAGENESTDRVAVAVCSVRVKFSSSISLRNVDLRKVANTGDLYIVRSLNVLECRVDGQSQVATCDLEGTSRKERRKFDPSFKDRKVWASVCFCIPYPIRPVRRGVL